MSKITEVEWTKGSCVLSAQLLCPLSYILVQNPSGMLTKTIEVCLHKEGNSFGFVMRGRRHWKHGMAYNGMHALNTPKLLPFFL